MTIGVRVLDEASAAARAVRLIEMRCGAYWGEDDIARYSDVYGRAAQ